MKAGNRTSKEVRYHRVAPRGYLKSPLCVYYSRYNIILRVLTSKTLDEGGVVV